jgi:hypothetical protein
MPESFTTIVERLQQACDQTAADVSDRVRVAQANDATARGTLPAGTRVFDSVSGREGVVEAAPLVRAGAQVLLTVRTPDHAILLRPLDQLIVRPTPPSVK